MDNDLSELEKLNKNLDEIKQNSADIPFNTYERLSIESMIGAINILI